MTNYFFDMFWAKVLHCHIEVVDVLVDVVRASVLNTYSFTGVKIFVLITPVKHKPFNPKFEIVENTLV